MGNSIKISDVQPGMVIVRITRQNGAIKIKKSGLVSSPEMITGLAEMGVQEVEIDPSQTVEIDLPGETPVAIELTSTQGPLRSPTRQLLDTGTGVGHKADRALSEQFSRSVFLPSVQDIPSPWQYYSKPMMTVLLIVCGGLAIGWMGATYQQWLRIFATQTEQVASNTVPLKRLQKDTTEVGGAPTAEPGLAKVPLEQVAEGTAETIAELDTVKAATPGNEKQTGSAVTESQGSLKGAQEQNAISPALLKRFEEAINQLDGEPDTVYQQPVESVGDVPRIDQLPAWIMTQLPTMTFSAHMYASNIEERWVRVNGRRMVEGDMIEGKARIVSIEPQRLILNFQGEDFSMAALTDW